MTVLVNGKESGLVSASDRGLLYGQSLFETIAIHNGQACLLDAHLARLDLGAARLAMPFDRTALNSEIHAIAAMQEKAVIRVTLSAGVGGRGYLNPESMQSTRIVSLHDFPKHPKDNWSEGIELGLADLQLGHQPFLAGIKHGNRLEQIIARSQWQAGWGEALLMDHHEHVIEATQSNVFVLNNNHLGTPDLSQAGVAGVMREFVLAHAEELGLEAVIVSLSLADIASADAVFVTNSVIGAWPVKRFQSTQYTDFSAVKRLQNLMIRNGAIPNI